MLSFTFNHRSRKMLVLWMMSRQTRSAHLALSLNISRGQGSCQLPYQLRLARGPLTISTKMELMRVSASTPMPVRGTCSGEGCCLSLSTSEKRASHGRLSSAWLGRGERRAVHEEPGLGFRAKG